MTQLIAEVHQQIFASWILLGASDWTEADRDKLFGLLARHNLSIIDLPRTFLAVGVAAAQPRPGDKTYERLWRMFGQLASDNANIRTTARKKLDALLAKHGIGWAGPNGFTSILLAYWAAPGAPVDAAAADTVSDVPSFDALELTMWLLDEHLVVTPAQCMVIALWCLATHVCDMFEHSPRLGAIGPASGMGKSTLLKLLNQLASEPKLTDNVTPAAIYRRLEDHPKTTYLIDEAENQGLLSDRVLRAVLDGGYEHGGSVDRANEEFPIYFPCAYAIRGERNDVPGAILSRSHIIDMQRGKPRKKFKTSDPVFAVAREIIAKWRVTAHFNLDPEMPAVLSDPRNPRLEDNCVPLIAVADTFAGKHDEAARAALIEFCADLPLPDAGIQVLEDIRAVPFERISDKALVAALLEMSDYWDAWRGPNDQGAPHALTTRELKRLLRRFGIRSRNHWPTPRLENSKSFSGFRRTDFEQAWAEHCPESSTTPQPNKIIALVKP
jgi:Protein of unknown function (DUF3631)